MTPIICIAFAFILLKHKKWLAVIISIALIAISLLVNPIYYEDFNKEGTYLTNNINSNNEIAIFLKEYKECLVVIGSVKCPHCQLAAKQLEILSKDNPKLDIIYFLHSSNPSRIKKFKNITGAISLNYNLVPDKESSLELSRGQFPTFLYVKNGELVHRWTNNEFGFPAMDWVANKLEN